MSIGARSFLLAILGSMLIPASAAQAAFPGGNGDIAFGRSSRQQVDIWVVAPGVTGTMRITNTPNRTESMPDWNAAGTRIAYVRCVGTKTGNCDIFTMDADGGDRARLTSTPEVQETWPSWSPDGTAIAFTSNAEDSFQDIWVMDDDGSNQTRLTTTAAFDAFPEWSPDGNSIAFTSNRAAADDIWVMDA
ncbi:MAG: TolB family protein, partial [Actinomycetota bacterium]